MNNAPALLRTLIIFTVVVPLAVFIGYLLANPMDASTFTYVGIMTAILLFPVLLRWHHPLLVLSWNSGMFVFLLPGRPHLWLVMTIISLGITLLQRALGGVKKLISVPSVTWSLVCMTGVVVLTAKLTGMGVHAFGSEISGGRRYFYLLLSILSYFALSSRRIPPEHAGLYIGMFCLPGLTGFISDLVPILPGSMYYIYLFFPASPALVAAQSSGEALARLGGALSVSFAIFSYMVAKYGLRGIFLSGKSWRWVVFAFAPAYLLFSGFRGAIMFFFAMFAIQFYFEGLHRTKLLPILTSLGISAAVLLVLVSPRLPYSVQRALAFLPLQIDSQVQANATQSLDWRLDMWKALLPQIPQYLLLGKGYAINRRDIDALTGSNVAIRTIKGFDENQYMALSGTYHNGPLSVVMTFGIWGVITVIWFWAAGVWVLSHNYRYGDPALKKINLFLLVAFVSRIIYFLTIFGSIDLDILIFGGWLGLSVALNGGVCQPAPAPATAGSKLPDVGSVRAHLQPTFRRPNVQI
jgi:hypothetical protein